MLPFLRRCPTFRPHCRGWVVDCVSRQAYNAFVIIVPCKRWEWAKLPKTLPVWAYQSKVTCESMVRLHQRAVYLPTADKYRRRTRRLSQEQKGLDERALMVSAWPSHLW